MRISDLYEKMYDYYSSRGWWPLLSMSECEGYTENGYHPGLFPSRMSPEHIFEITAGAVLTQNTAWKNAAAALRNLLDYGCSSFEQLIEIDIEKLSLIIKSAGFFNIKAERLRNCAEFFIENGVADPPSRNQLLSIKGVGEETADSILLYAFQQPQFVVDAYTRRIFKRLGLISDKKHSYGFIKELIESSIESDFKIYSEYHALIVEHAKTFCTSKPRCSNCFLRKNCITGSDN